MSDPATKPEGEAVALPSAFGRLTCYQISDPAPKADLYATGDGA